METHAMVLALALSRTVGMLHALYRPELAKDAENELDAVHEQLWSEEAERESLSKPT